MKYLHIKKIDIKKQKEPYTKIADINLNDFDLCDFLLNRENRP